MLARCLNKGGVKFRETMVVDLGVQYVQWVGHRWLQGLARAHHFDLCLDFLGTLFADILLADTTLGPNRHTGAHKLMSPNRNIGYESGTTGTDPRRGVD